MPIRVVCPGCESAGILSDAASGRGMRCGQCQQLYRVPTLAELRSETPALGFPSISRSLAKGLKKPDRVSRLVTALVGSIVVTGFLAITAAVVVAGVLSRSDPSEPSTVLAPDEPPPALVRTGDPQPLDVIDGERIDDHDLIEIAPPPPTPPVEPARRFDPPTERPGVDVVSLGTRAGNICPGPLARSLLIHFPDRMALAEFDLQTRRMNRSIELRSDRALFAANRNAVFVLDPVARRIERYGPTQTKPEKVENMLVPGEPLFFLTGHHADRPIWYATYQHREGHPPLYRLVLFDPDTLRRLDVRDPLPESPIPITPSLWAEVSANGENLFYWNASSSEDAPEVVRLTQPRYNRQAVHLFHLKNIPGPVLPTADGTALWSPQGGHGVLPSNRHRQTPISEPIDGLPPVSSATGRLALNFDPEGAVLHAFNTSKPLFRIPEVPIDFGVTPKGATGPPTHRRVTFVPDLGVVVRLSPGEQWLELVTFNTTSKLIQHGHDFRLALSSIDPPDDPPRSSSPPTWRSSATYTIQTGSAPRREGFEPCPIEGDVREVPLPGRVGAICVGGNGRFLIMHLPTLSRLVVVDVNVGEIVKTLEVPDEPITLAAGRNHLMIGLVNSNQLQRWNLPPTEREAVVDLPTKAPSRGGPPHQLIGLAMGHDSDGPLLIARGEKNSLGTHAFMDVTRMEPITFDQPIRGSRARPGMSYLASFDGSLFTMADGVNQPSIIRYPVHPHGSSPGMLGREPRYLMPGYPSGVIYSDAGRFRSIPMRQETPPIPDWPEWEIPAVHDPFYLRVRLDERSDGRASLRAYLHVVNTNRPIAYLGELPTINDLLVARRHPYDLPLHQHLFLVPRANVLVVLSADRDRLSFHRLDPEAELERSGVDYVFVQNRPIAAIEGQLFIFQPWVRSNHAKVKVRLQVPNSDMTTHLRPDGKVVLNSPRVTPLGVPIRLEFQAGNGPSVVEEFWLQVIKPSDRDQLPTR